MRHEACRSDAGGVGRGRGGEARKMLIKYRGVDVSTFRRVDVKCKCASEVRRTADLRVEV